MIQIRWIKYKLKFNFEAGTSRGVLREKNSYFLIIKSAGNFMGIGECGPLPGLSIDFRPDYEQVLTRICRHLTNRQMPDIHNIDHYIKKEIPEDLPSIKMGFEMAWRDFFNRGQRVIFENNFIHGEAIPINGLIWMGSGDEMKKRINEKIKEGFSCIKIKIGSLQFEKELEVLEYLRDQEGGKSVSLRLDANGAFSIEEAPGILDKLKKFRIHSIEQPIKAGQPEAMADICRHSAIPIALDEELIGIHSRKDKIVLLEKIKPHFIVLKPSLIGGLAETKEWIELAEERKIGWWITSALESNVGLNAIAQFTAEFPVKMEQGLGTGKIYSNNLPSPLILAKGRLYYSDSGNWDFTSLHID